MLTSQCYIYKNNYKQLEEKCARPRNHYILLKKTVMIVLFAFIAAIFCKLFIVNIFAIPSSSMSNTLKSGDRILVSKLHDGSRVFGIRVPIKMNDNPVLAFYTLKTL
jgi:signal peptidase I